MTSIALLVAIRDGSVHKGPAKHLLLTIGTYADHADGSDVRASVPTLCEATGIPERTVYRLLGRLVASGELSIESGRGRTRSNVYRVNRELLIEHMRARRAARHPSPENLPTAAGKPATASQKVPPAPGFGTENLPQEPGLSGENLPPEPGLAPTDGTRGRKTCQTPPENLPTAAGKPAKTRPPEDRVRSDRVNEDRETPAAAARARATISLVEMRELLGHVSGLDPGDPLLCEVLAGFPDLDPREQLVEIAAYAKTRPREAWSTDRVRRWVQRSDERRRERANGATRNGAAGGDAAAARGVRRPRTVGAGEYAAYSRSSDPAG